MVKDRAMKSKDLYERLLGLGDPWQVKDVAMDVESRTVEVRVECREKTVWVSEDGRRLHVHGWEEREWRELNTLQFQTIIRCKVPRLKDPDSGKTENVPVPWAGKHSRFTLMFEAFAVQVLECSASVEAARKILGLDWRSVDEIRCRAVERGLERREREPIAYLGIDEKSFRKGHHYVSISSDLAKSRVLEVSEGRTEESADHLMGNLNAEQRESVKAVALDMWPAFMNTCRRHVPLAFIVHDRFHVSKHLGDAIDQVRRQENKRLCEEGDQSLKRTRWLWLKRSHSEAEEQAFQALEKDHLDVAKAWQLRELFDRFWSFRDPEGAEAFFHGWFSRAMDSGLAAVKRVAKMLKNHLEGLLGYCFHPVSNAISEGFNSKIQAIKANARGFRSFEKYRIAILFHCGKLDMIPR